MSTKTAQPVDTQKLDVVVLLRREDSPFEFPGLRYVSDVEESKAIDLEDRPSIIISASGMCEAGRVLHHLRCTIEDSKNTVVIVGFQAQYTLGRRLVERRSEVRIFGMMRARRAEVVVLNGFSAHADQKGLLDFARERSDPGTAPEGSAGPRGAARAGRAHAGAHRPRVPDGPCTGSRRAAPPVS